MRRCLTLAAALLLLAGCAPVAREPDRLALVRVLGVDGSDPVSLTAVCGSAEPNGVLRGAATAATFEGAKRAVVWSGEGMELSLTGVSYLLVASDVDLEAVLLEVLADADLGASTTVWMVEGGAGAALNRCRDPAAELELLALSGAAAPSVAQAEAALSTRGEVVIPCLKLKRGRLEKEGDAIWRSADS